MPSIISHPALPLAIGIGLGTNIISRRLLAAGVVASIVPDIDVYLRELTSSIAHRGITHTIVFALACGALAAMLAKTLQTQPAIAFAFVGLAALSHPILDAFTTGGSGIPFFWPLSGERYFMPWRVIEVSPLGISRFLSGRALTILASEFKWIWLPAIAIGAALYAWRRRGART